MAYQPLIKKSYINMNGNSRNDFMAAYSALKDAADAISKARGVVASNVTNGRNYTDVDECVAERRAVDAAFTEAYVIIGGLMSDVSDKITD